MKRQIQRVQIRIWLLNFLIFFFSASNGVVADELLCTKEKDAFKCLKMNFQQFYHSDIESFFKIYRQQKEKAKSCKNVKATAEFLDIAKVIEGNAEVAESFGEFVDNIILKNTVCFLDAALLLDQKSLEPLIQFYVKVPFTKEGQEGVKRAMDKYKKFKKYSRIMKLYYSAG